MPPTDRHRITFRWQRHPGGRPTVRLREIASAALDRVRGQAVEVGVLVCDDATMRSLNRHFRSKDATTDVLSFPVGFDQPDGPPYLGDVAISLDTAARQAKAAGHALGTELGILMIHALLHLCGYDHETDAGEMRDLENALRGELLG